MTPLLFLSLCVVGCLAYIQGNDIKGPDYAINPNKIQARHLHEAPANGEVIDITYNIVAKKEDAPSPVQKIAAPSATSGVTHQVTVGGDAGLVYIPNSINAAIGDVVQFNFMSTNHTVTQSTFAKPCVKLEGGVDSGFMPNPNNTKSPPPSFLFQVKDKKEKWFYCRQKSHCGMGMTFSINPTANLSHARFMHLAILQNGTADGPSGTPGNYTTPSAAVSSPPPASAPSPANLVVPPAGTQPGSIASGDGGPGCSCSCLCGVAAFPAGVGIGMFGGIPGAVPAT